MYQDDLEKMTDEELDAELAKMQNIVSAGRNVSRQSADERLLSPAPQLRPEDMSDEQLEAERARLESGGETKPSWWRGADDAETFGNIEKHVASGGAFSHPEFDAMSGREFNAYRRAVKRNSYAAQGLNPDEEMAREQQESDAAIEGAQNYEDMLRARLKYVIGETDGKEGADKRTNEKAKKYLANLDKANSLNWTDRQKELASQSVAEMYEPLAKRRGSGRVFADALKRGYTSTAIMAEQAWLGMTGGDDPENVEKMRRLQTVGEEWDAANPKKINGVSEIRGAGDVWDFVLESIGENLQRGATAIASGLAGGAAFGVAGAMTGAGLSTLALNTGEAVQDQLAEGVPFSRGWALAQGVGYSVLDGVFGIEAGLGKLAVKTGLRAAKDTAVEGLKEVGKMATKRGALKQFAKGLIGEALQEPAQSQLVGRGRRWAQTDSPLRKGETVGEAWMEALDETAGGAAAALGLGGGGTVISHANARRIVGIHNRVVNAIKEDAAFKELSPEHQLLVAKKLMNDSFMESNAVSAEDKAAMRRQNQAIENELGREDADAETRAASDVLRGFDLTFAKEDFADTVETAKADGIKSRVDFAAMRDSAKELGEVPGGYRGVRYTDPATGLSIVQRIDHGKGGGGSGGKTVDFIVENNRGFKDSLTGDAQHAATLDEALMAVGDLDIYNQYRAKKSASKRQIIADMFKRMYGGNGTNLVIADSLAAMQDPAVRAQFAEKNGKAAYDADSDTVFILADRIDTIGQLYTDLAHEKAHRDIAAHILGKDGGAETDEERAKLAKGRERVFGSAGDAEDGEERFVERMSIMELYEAVRDSNRSLPGALAAWIKRKISDDTGIVAESISDDDVRTELNHLIKRGYFGTMVSLAGKPVGVVPFNGDISEEKDADMEAEVRAQSNADAKAMSEAEANRAKAVEETRGEGEETLGEGEELTGVEDGAKERNDAIAAKVGQDRYEQDEQNEQLGEQMGAERQRRAGERIVAEQERERAAKRKADMEAAFADAEQDVERGAAKADVEREQRELAEGKAAEAKRKAREKAQAERERDIERPAVKAAKDAEERAKVAEKAKAQREELDLFKEWNRQYDSGETDLDFDEWRKQPPEARMPKPKQQPTTAKPQTGGTNDEAGNGADEASAQPEQGGVAEQQGEGETARPMEGREEGGEAAGEVKTAQGVVTTPQGAPKSAGAAAEEARARETARTGEDASAAQNVPEAKNPAAAKSAEAKPMEKEKASAKSQTTYDSLTRLRQTFEESLNKDYATTEGRIERREAAKALDEAISNANNAVLIETITKERERTAGEPIDVGSILADEAVSELNRRGLHFGIENGEWGWRKDGELIAPHVPVAKKSAKLTEKEKVAAKKAEAKRNPTEKEKVAAKKAEVAARKGVDAQGNPVGADGKLKLESVESVDELTDADFTKPTRSVRLPKIPANIDAAIGADGKPVIIKRNIFDRNHTKHGDLTPTQSREILNAALYSPDLYGQNQKASRPHNWVVINVPMVNGNNRLVLLEVNRDKDNVEIVHWHYVDDKGLEKIRKQAAREDGQLLILPSASTEEAGALSGPTSGSTGNSISKTAESRKPAENEREFEAKQTREMSDFVSGVSGASIRYNKVDAIGEVRINGKATAFTVDLKWPFYKGEPATAAQYRYDETDGYQWQKLEAAAKEWNKLDKEHTAEVYSGDNTVNFRSLEEALSFKKWLGKRSVTTSAQGGNAAPEISADDFVMANSTTDAKGRRVANNDIDSLGEIAPLPDYATKKVKPAKPGDAIAALKAVGKNASRQEDSRFALKRVHVEGGQMVATDGRRIVVAPAPGGVADGDYDAKGAPLELKDRQATFPKNWRQVVPDVKEHGYRRIGEIANGDAAHGRIAFAGETADKVRRAKGGDFAVQLRVGNESVNPQFVKEVVNTMFALGAERIEVFQAPDYAPVVFKGRNAKGEITGAVVPLRIEGEGGDIIFEKRTHVKLFSDAANAAQTDPAAGETALDPEIAALPGGGYRYRGQTYRTRAAAEKALERERTTFRNGDMAALAQEGGKPLTGMVRVMPDGSISLRVKENVPRSAENPDGQRVRDVPVKDKTKLVKLIDNGGKTASGLMFKRSDADLQHDYDEVVRRYTNADGTKKRGWMRAPNGQPTKLTERQWVQVRTPAFKEWFGDWESSARRLLLDAAKAARIAQGVFKKIGDKSIQQTASEMLKDPVVHKTEIGDITIDKRSAHDSLAHRYSQKKLDALVTIQQDFANAVYLGSERDFDGKDITNHYFAYPIDYGEDGERNLVFCRAQEDKNANRLYVHEVFLESELKNNGDALQAAAASSTKDASRTDASPFASPRGIALARIILQRLFADNSTSRVVDENGEPLVVYHGTKDDFTAFTDGQGKRYDAGYLGRGFYFTDREESGRNYAEWKRGFGAPHTMAAFLSIKNPLVLAGKGPNLSVVQNVLGMGEPENTMSVTTMQAENIRSETEKRGYDGIIRRLHDGETIYVAFEPTQIKSATDNTGAFDGAERDIRFKRGENERAADDTSVWFGAKASMSAHGFDARTAKEMGINITNKGTVAAARSLVADVRRMNEIITFALTSDRPLSAEENTALVILAQNLNADLGRINKMMAESANPEAFQAEKELVEAKYNKALEALNKAGTHTGQSMQSLKIGIPDDVRDSEIYILRSIQAERRKQGAAPDDAADTAMAKALHEENQKLANRIKELEKQVADLSQYGVKEKRAAENVSKGKSEARGATLSPERRARAAKVVGHSIDDEDASILAGFNAEFGEALSFKGGLNEKGSVLSDNAKALFAAYVKKHGYDETERVLKSQYPKAMSAWAEFRRQNEKKSADDLAKLALPVTKQRLVTTRDLAETRKECKRQLDENAGDPYQQRIAIGHYLRRYMDALINENPDVPMKELQEKMAEEATDLTGTKHDPVAMLAVMAGVEGYDLETRAEILRKIAKSRHALQLFREGKVNEAARESGLLYEDEATALDQLQKTLEQIIMEKQNEIDYLSAFSEKNKEAVERVKQLKADLKEAEDALAIMHKQVSLAERKAKFAEVLEKRIAEAQQAADALRGEVESDEFKERKAKIDTKIAELKAALAVAKRDEMSLKKIQDKIAEYEKRIADGDYDRALQTYRANDAKLQAKLALARERRKELRRKHEAAIRARNYREMGIVGKTLYGTMGILGEMKGVVASFDLSSVLRQGGQLSWAHPFIASKNLKTVLAAMSDEKKCDELMAQLRLRPNWKYYEQAEVEFTDYGEGATNKEDVFLLNQYRRITNAKLLKAGVQMSERAFTTFLNLMRADVFDAMVGGSTFGSAANMNDSQLKAIGRFINIASQRGTHDMGVGLAAKIVNTLLWSPRNVVSRFQFLWETGKLLGGGAAYGDKTLRSLFAKELVRYIGGMSAAAMFLKAVAELFRDDDDPPNEMEFDPRSSDFLKVRFGNVRVDLTSGLTPILVFGARFFSRKSKNLRGQTRDFNAAEGFGKFLRQKFSPSAAIVWDLAHGEDFEKRDIEWTSLWEKDNERISAYRYLLGSFAPLSVADLMEQAEQGGLPKTFVTGAMSLLGANVQAFDPYNFKQLKGDYTYFKGLYDKAIDPEERRHLLEYHPMLKRRSRIESALKRVRDLENIKKKAEKRGYQRLDLDEPIKRAKEVAIGIMAGID